MKDKEIKTVVVVPTIRKQGIRDFLSQWKIGLKKAKIIVIEDNPGKTFDIKGFSNVTHYAWEDIDKDLGENAWIIPRRTDCIRSYGFYKAYFTQPDMVVTLDDDCYPLKGQENNFLGRHWERLEESVSDEAWYETGEGVTSRGVPYFNRSRIWRCVLNHGLWKGIPDLDAPTQLANSRTHQEFICKNQIIPIGKYFPMCGMNLAFRPEIIPALYFLLMGKDYPYDRFGDIWSGIFLKKICDHLGYAIHSGEPVVLHQRASNVWSNLRKEEPGLEVNEKLWKIMDRIVLKGRTFGECYMQLAKELDFHGEYWDKLKSGMQGWTKLFTSFNVTLPLNKSVNAVKR